MPQKASYEDIQQVLRKQAMSRQRVPCLRPGLHTRLSEGSNCLSQDRLRVKSQKTGAKNSQTAKPGPFHKGQH